MIYNDMEFAIAKSDNHWEITRKLPDGNFAIVGTGLFAKLPDDEAVLRARTLIKMIYPVGIKIVGPNVTHPNKIGDLRIVGPDVTHPNFVYWDKDSTSFAFPPTTTLA